MKTVYVSVVVGLVVSAAPCGTQANAADRNGDVPAAFAELNYSRSAAVTFVDHDDAYRWHNGRWWYQRPNRSWSYYHDGGWHDHQPANSGRQYSYRRYSSGNNGYSRGRDYGSYGYDQGYGGDNYGRGNYGRGYGHDGHTNHGHDGVHGGGSIEGNVGGFRFSY